MSTCGRSVISPTVKNIQGPVSRRRKPLVALGCAVVVCLVATGCAGAEQVAGNWEGEIEDDSGDTIALTFELEPDGSEITGDGTANGEAPLEVTGGEASGSEVNIEFQDGFGGESVQGELNGELDGDTISGEGSVYSSNSSGEPQPFELQRTQQ